MRSLFYCRNVSFWLKVSASSIFKGEHRQRCQQHCIQPNTPYTHPINPIKLIVSDYRTKSLYLKHIKSLFNSTWLNKDGMFESFFLAGKLLLNCHNLISIWTFCCFAFTHLHMYDSNSKIHFENLRLFARNKHHLMYSYNIIHVSQGTACCMRHRESFSAPRESWQYKFIQENHEKCANRLRSER